MLLAGGADPNTKDHLTKVPLMLNAALGGLTDIVEAFVTAGADVDMQSHEDLTALHLGAGMGHGPVVELLLAHGADVNGETAGKATPLWFAERGGHEEVAELLREHGAVEKYTGQTQ